MSVEQLEESVLKLSEAERRQFAEWFYDHENKIVEPADHDDISPGVKAEILRRSAELRDHPELAEPVDEAYFERMKRRVANALSRKASAV